MGEFVVITGLSGAGRSHAANILEDLGWFVIDNLPPSLIPKVASWRRVHRRRQARRVVVGTGPYHDEVLPPWRRCTSRPRLRIVFLEAATDVLVRRYEAPAASPLGGAGAWPTPSTRRRLLESVKAEADVVVDTSS
ncbi:MAG: RNase adapter RapZ [Acidimicrobiales bacterium]